MKAAPGPRAPAARVVGWSDPAFARVAEVVHLVAGLVFPPNRQPSAESGMRRAMGSLRIADPDALRRAVQHPGEARDAVLAELTVGETYFFRESAQLDVLRTDILPSLLGRRDADRPLRLWSAGCASGEEPYTLAIMLRELGWPHPARIIGTDVARPRLDAAERGRYTRWSLRGVAPARVERWFTRRASHFQLDPEIRAAVRFSTLNLIADEYPSVESGTQDQDVVLCRNVLIYFDMASVERIATRLLASLALDGWLLLGASDPPLSGLVPCEVIMTPGGVVYRRADRPGARVERSPLALPLAWDATPLAWSASRTLPVVAAPADEAPHIGRGDDTPPSAPAAADSTPRVGTPPATTTDYAGAYAAADYAAAESRARAAVEHDSNALGAWVVLVRAIANQGQLRAAEELCTRALDLHRLAPELHYLHATLLSAAGQFREAANAARRALYLDRRFIMASMQLGDALARLGDPERAAHAFANARRELAQLTDDDSIPAADGVSASRLRHVAELRLAAIGEARSA